MKKKDDGIIHFGSYFAGWLDGSIRSFLSELASNSKSMHFALITALDSDLEPAALARTSPELKGIAKDIKKVGPSLLVPTAVLLRSSETIFYGFDEVWFFPHDQVTPKPRSAWLVGPNRITREKMRKLGPWAAKNECSLALGDGGGLNFFVKARGIAPYLFAMSLRQPEPAVHDNDDAGEEPSAGQSPSRRIMIS